MTLMVASHVSAYEQLILFGDSLFENANTQEHGFAPVAAIQQR